MTTGRVLPINRAMGGGGYNEGDLYPKAAMQSVTMGIRVGDANHALGYIDEFSWNMSRDAQPIHQIEPFPNGTFGGGSFTVDFPDSYYWPGEVIEIIPGKVDAIPITLNRYALYTSSVLAAAFRLQEVINGTPVGNIQETLPATDPVNLNGTTPNNYVSLIQQVRPIDIYQIYYSPYDGTMIYGRKFEECWFTELSEQIPTSSENQAILENASLQATRIRPYNKSVIAP